MQFTIGLALVAALGAAACKKSGPTGSSTGTGSGPGSATTSTSASESGSAGVALPAGGSAGSAAAAFEPKAALDAALKAKGVADKDVTKRATGPHSGWALVVSKRRDDHDVLEYTLIRASAAGVAELRIPAREGGDRPALDVDVDTFDIRDLDGDGRDECVTVLAWQLDHEFPYPKGCKHCRYGEGENGKQLYVIADKAGALAVAFTHLVEYATLSQPGTADDPDPPPAEKVAYDWKVEGTPPAVTLTRTDAELNPKRPHELLDPATDPLLAAGSGATVTLVLK